MIGKWVRKRLVDIGPISKGAGISRSQSNSGDIPAVRYGEIYTHHEEYVKSYVSHISSDVARTSLLTKKGDILFAGSGETPDEIGKCVAVIDDGVYAGGDIVVFSPPQGADPIYWGCLLNLPYVQRQKAMRAQGSSIYHLRPDATGTIVVEYADDDKVQHHIAEILSTCDEVIEKSERAKEKLRRIKDGLLADLMTRGIGNDGKIRPRPSKAPHLYKQSELGLIPKEWDVKRLGNVCSIQLGKMLDAAKNVGVEKPYLGNKAVQWGRIDLAAVEKVRLTDADMAKFRLRMGDLLVCEGGEVGRCVIWNDELPECYYQKAIHRLRMIDSESGSIPYLAGLFAWYAAHDMFRAYVTQTSIAHLPKEKLEALVVTWPKKDEQDQIADRLAAVDERIDSEEKAIVKYRKIKAGSMNRLLTPPSGAEIVDLVEGAT